MIFVTGASGFLGGLVLDELSHQGIPVKALSRSPRPERPGVTWVQTHLRYIEMPHLLDGVDTIIHLAGLPPASSPQALHTTHVKGTEALLRAAQQAGVRRFLYMSSLDAGLDPLSPYGRSKRLAEDFVRASALDWCILRPSIMYGPGGRNAISQLIDFARQFHFIPMVGGGKFRWQPVYAPDVVAGVMEWLSAPPDWPGLQIITGPDRVTFKEIVLQIGAALGKPVVDFSIPRFLWQAAAIAPITPIRSMLHAARDKLAVPAPPGWIIRTGACDLAHGLLITLRALHSRLASPSGEPV
jgi:uncharacterized protein YbjT (DUF2867 family)